MKEKKSGNGKKNGNELTGAAGLGRRDLMKLGAGVVVGHMLNVPRALAQETSASSQPSNTPPYFGVHPPTRRLAKAGYKNTSGRAFGNGPMDETSKRITDYVFSFSESNLSDQLVKDVGEMMIDSIGCAIAGFESDSIRIGAKMAHMTQSSGLKSTVLGYGITTTPDLAAYVGSGMVRYNDFNENGGHSSDTLPAILAIGEAVHATGSQVLAAMTLTLEVYAGLARGTAGKLRGIDNLWVGPAAAMGAGKLLGLNQDQLGNALSLALVPHIPLSASHSGVLCMMKSLHDAESVRCGVWAALLAREGMTGPAQPFEGRGGLCDYMVRPPFDIKLPVHAGNNPIAPLAPSDGRFYIQTLEYKRTPSEGGTQAILETIPEFRKFAKVDDIESIYIEMTSFGDDIGDPVKWDPLNDETADHSMPYCIARALMDGDFYLNAFKKESYTDPKARELMAKITIQENPDLKMSPRMTVRRKSGGELTKEVGHMTLLTHDEISKKFDRICAYKGIPNSQRDQIRSIWSDLRPVKNIADPIRTTLANFGKPKAF